jgi:hypothetical protein
VGVRRASAALLLAAATAGLASGCGGGSAADARAKAEIQRNWEAFFDVSTPAAKRVGLLQDGDRFAALLRTMAANPLARQLAVKVSKVELGGDGTATVTYTLSIGGNQLLQGAKGTAVQQGGRWKVGIAAFCGLLTLQGSTPKPCPAPAK